MMVLKANYIKFYLPTTCNKKMYFPTILCLRPIIGNQSTNLRIQFEEVLKKIKNIYKINYPLEPKQLK